MTWDPQQYARYTDERSRPFFELTARIDVASPHRVVDLGCGPGPLTASLAERWPEATVIGVDDSVDMIRAAGEHSVAGRIEFVQASIADWQPAEPVDVVVANAALQWVPGHINLLGRFAGWLEDGGALAFQVPDNFTEPSHTLLRDLRVSPRWRAKVGAGADRTVGVERPERYLAGLVAAGLAPDVWQTSYIHILYGDDPVLEWVKGTALRPVLSLLDANDCEKFVDEYAQLLREAYPAEPWGGTLFPFRRTFAVGHKH